MITLLSIFIGILTILALTTIHYILSAIFLSLSPKYYVLFGVSIKKKKLNYDFIVKNPNNDYVVKKTVGNYLFSNDARVYAVPKVFWLGWFNFKTRFSLRMLGRIESNSVLVDIRISLFSILMAIAIIAALIIIIIWGYTSDPFNELAFFGGIIALVAMGVANIQPLFAVEDNCNSMIQELNEVITNHNNGYDQ